MLYRDEIKILRALKLAPFFMVAFSIVVIIAIVKNNNLEFEQEVQKIRQDSIAEKKALIQREVERVYDFIDNQKKHTIENIRRELKSRVYEAHAVATAIYQNNQHRPEAETKRLISDALRNIRFNDGRGYFFIYQSQGINVMHPILSELEGQNLWEFKDVKGSYVIQNLSRIAKQNGEGFYDWWWRKPADVENEYEKIGFGKYFAPYDWFIGTGDYVLDYEAELKQQLLSHINNIRFGENGYIFVVDKSGVYLSHIKLEYINQNRIDLIDENGTYVTREIIQAAQTQGKYLSYTGTIQPSTGQIGEKISYIKGFKDWDWAIGAGAYLSEIEEVIAQKKQALDKSNQHKIIQIALLSFIMTAAIFILTLIFSNNLKRRFQTYKDKVEEKTDKLDHLNRNLEHQVVQRTQELELSLAELKNTQQQLIESEKMASLGGLVAGVAHEMNTPIGIGLTGITHLVDITQELKAEYQMQEMTAESFERYIESADELSRIININLNRTAELIKSFKQVSVDQTNEELRDFNVQEYMQEVLLSLKSVTRQAKVNVELDCNELLRLNSYPGSLSQIITNLVMNSVKHGFKDTGPHIIKLAFNEKANELIIDYQDNGVGIAKENHNKIFDPFFTTNRDQGGTGLGLNIIYNIITTKLKGSIRYQAPEKQGVHFIITLPMNRVENKTVA